MKSNIIIKVTPFLSTLFLISFLSIINQKEYAKLRILIWNTPKLTLGTYIAISTGTGFILSSILTSYFAKIITTKHIKTHRVNEEDDTDIINEYAPSKNTFSYDNILIERDIKEPSPTIDASFRIIGKNKSTNLNNKNINNNDESDDLNDVLFQNDENPNNEKSLNEERSISTDWHDDSYASW